MIRDLNEHITMDSSNNWFKADISNIKNMLKKTNIKPDLISQDSPRGQKPSQECAEPSEPCPTGSQLECTEPCPSGSQLECADPKCAEPCPTGSKLNPGGKRCFCCGSRHHMLARCPDHNTQTHPKNLIYKKKLSE